MKLLLDQGLPRSTIGELALRGIAAEHVGDVGLAAADFHMLLATSGAVGPSVIRIRIQGLHAVQLAILLEQVVNMAGADLSAGALVSVTSPGLIRIRSLPVR
jgi:predicted nuclease of predicted toxin-antitoxin system